MIEDTHIQALMRAVEDTTPWYQRRRGDRWYGNRPMHAPYSKNPAPYHTPAHT